MRFMRGHFYFYYCIRKLFYLCVVGTLAFSQASASVGTRRTRILAEETGVAGLTFTLAIQIIASPITFIQ